MNMKDVKSIGARIANGQKAKSQNMIDAAAIRELSELLTETGLTEIEIEQNGARIRVARYVGAGPAQLTVHAAPSVGPTTAEPAAKGPTPGGVPSPMVGTVYTAP